MKYTAVRILSPKSKKKWELYKFLKKLYNTSI
jgi:hypothetical protein